MRRHLRKLTTLAARSRDVRTRTKVFSGFTLAVALTLVLGATSWRSNAGVNERVSDLTGRRFAGYRSLAAIESAQGRAQAAANALLHLDIDADARRQLAASLEEALAAFRAARAAFGELTLHAADRERWDGAQMSMEIWLDATTAFAAHARRREELVSAGGGGELVTARLEAQNAWLETRDASDLLRGKIA